MMNPQRQQVQGLRAGDTVNYNGLNYKVIKPNVFGKVKIESQSGSRQDVDRSLLKVEDLPKPVCISENWEDPSMDFYQGR